MGDPRDVIAERPMTRAQWIVVALCVMLNALDGFDVLSVSFAAPGITHAWQIDRAALGFVLAMELAGMTIGSICLGALCDRWGRRPVVLLCLVVMASGMAAAALSSSLASLSVCRLYTGLGIGGMLAATNALVAEVASTRRKYLAVTLMAGGYPAGAVVGGIIASALLTRFAWPVVFVVGAVMSAALIPAAMLLLPESVAFLAGRRRPGALAMANKVLARLGHSPADTIDAAEPGGSGAGLRRLFASDLRRTTILMTSAYFAHMTTFYFILKWVPKIVADLGFQPSAAGGVLVWANVGGLVGALSFSLLTQRVDAKPLALVAMLGSALMVSLFGRSPPTLQTLSTLAAAAGVFTNGAVVCLYALLATRFPAQVRALGTGFAIGIGRGGAAISPIVVGQLFALGLPEHSVAMVISVGSLIGFLAIATLPASNRIRGITG